jgi:mRNA interferase MazF
VAVAGQVLGRGQVYLVRLDPTLGSEIKKTRPCVIVSPDELNEHLRTVIVAPMTTGGRPYPWRPRCRFQGRAGFVALDQLRTVDVERLGKKLGALEAIRFSRCWIASRRCSPCNVHEEPGVRPGATSPFFLGMKLKDHVRACSFSHAEGRSRPTDRRLQAQEPRRVVAQDVSLLLG